MRSSLMAGLILTSSAIAAVPVHAAPKFVTYHINYVYLTPIKVQTLKTIDQFLTPDKGKIFLAVSFQVVNKDDVQQEVEYDDLKVTIPSGEVVEQGFESLDPELTGKVLVPGGKLSGNVTWQIPVNTHSVVLNWAPNPGFSDAKWPTYSWKLSF